MTAMIDLTGLRFGRWSVVGFSHIGNRGVAHWRVRCDCGADSTLASIQLRRGHSNSCGCMKRQLAAVRGIKHGHAVNGLRSREYTSWQAMHRRCEDPNAKGYENYGGRGIKVCDRWRNSFAAFYDDMGSRPASTTLDRINNDGGYEPGNCRWATRKEQRHNRREAA